MADRYHAFGPPELCTWSYGSGVCRFQTNNPDIARKLSQRAGARLVADSFGREYLRIFQEEIEPWRARQVVIRYLKPTNGAFFDGESSVEATKRTETAMTGDKTLSYSCRPTDAELEASGVKGRFHWLKASRSY